MNVSLKSKIHLMFAALIMGAGLLVATVFSILSNSEITRQLHRQSNSAQVLLSNEMGERAAQLKAQVTLVAQLPTLKSLVMQKVDDRTVNDWAVECVKETGADDLILTGGDGRLLGQGSRYSDHFEAKDLEGLKDALKGHPWTGVIDHHPCPMQCVTIPILNAGYVEGTITALRAIDSKTASELHEVLGTSLLIVSNKNIVGSSLTVPTKLDRLPTEETRLNLNGTDYVALYAPLPRTSIVQGMGFVTLQNYNEVAGPYRKLNAAFIVVMIGALVIAGLLSRRVANAITQPLAEVISAVGTIKQGEWPEQMAVKRNDEIGFLQSVFNDMIGALKESRAKLLAVLDIDPLTDLCNHRKFLERLDIELKRSLASRDDMSVLLLDLDNFSDYNAAAGHAAGDQVLQRVAEIIKRTTPEFAVLARYGGEEFAIVLPEFALDKACEIAESIRVKIRDDFAEDGITASVGCVQLDRGKHSASGIVLSAELALSTAKQLGKDQVSTSMEAPDTPVQLNDLASGNLATIQALAAAVDAKDPYTHGHSERVAQYAYDLARYVGVCEEEAKLIYRTGTLHDLGKIGVPDAILKKTGRLTREEEAVMQTHPALGEVIVRKVPQLADTLPGVRHHHERWDGKGYPDRLRGEAIPRVARFLAIADTFDAMTSDRPYRKGMAPEVAIDEIERNAGKQFDSELALAFGRLMRRNLQKAA